MTGAAGISLGNTFGGKNRGKMLMTIKKRRRGKIFSFLASHDAPSKIYRWKDASDAHNDATLLLFLHQKIDRNIWFLAESVGVDHHPFLLLQGSSKRIK